MSAPHTPGVNAAITFTPEQIAAIYLVLWRGRVRPEEPEKRPAFGWMEPALQEAEALLEPWHMHFHDRQFNAMNRSFFGDDGRDLPVAESPSDARSDLLAVLRLIVGKHYMGACRLAPADLDRAEAVIAKTTGSPTHPHRS